MPSHTDQQPEPGDNRVGAWSREFLIAQIVIVVIIAGALAFAVTSEERGLISVSTRIQGDVGPGIGIGSEITAPVSPVECSDSEGLAGDCAILLSIRAELAGDASLDWSEDVPVSEWEGVVVGGSLPRVLSLNLTTSGLTGIVPSELGELSELRYLHLYGNDLSGEIPSELGHLANLDTLDLGDNQLTGTIPAELGQLARLVSLDLSANQLTGTIPAQLGDLEGLEWLVIADNRLAGDITGALMSLPNLNYVNIEDNRLSGCIPEALRDVDGFLGDLPFCDGR